MQRMSTLSACVLATSAAIFVGLLSGCGGGGGSTTAEPVPPSNPPSVERDILPSWVDAGVDTATEANVVINPSPLIPAVGKLFVFLPGTQGIPDYYRLIVRAGASRGFHTIGLNYPNAEAVGTICLRESTDCFWDVRREVITGINYTPLISVDSTNSIVTRLGETVAYMNSNYPTEGWGQFLDVSGALDWTKIVVGGHSQGGGHAGVMAKLFTLAGACYFSSPADWSTQTDAPASWVAQRNLTPVDRQYAFGNVGDTLVPWDQLSVIWGAIGLPGSPVSVDMVGAPYDRSHRLTTAVPGSSGSPLISPSHGSTVLDMATPIDASGKAIFDPVWGYACFE